MTGNFSKYTKIETTFITITSGIGLNNFDFIKIF
ncbi:hypothetical protein X274_06105 [Marinitoga sp. 1155]|nr:hypothetical protein X274_06105 [Marinitoga sp. 1155]